MPNHIHDQINTADAVHKHKLASLQGRIPNERINDTDVYGDLNSPDALEVLSSELVVGFSAHAPYQAGNKWIQIRGSVAGALELLTHHPVQKKKEGTAFFFNETELTGKAITRNGNKLAYTYRGKAHAKSVTAFVLDVDGTDSIDRVRDKLIELGLFGFLYTTHSHARKHSPKGDYFRVIIPLKQPIQIASKRVVG